MQAYGKRAYPVLEWLANWRAGTGRVLPVRLVKGAYWDTEIKRAQEAGFEGYPLFTRKVSTDVSYLACARYMLSKRDGSIRSSPPTTPTPSPPSRSWRATTSVTSSSGCTAWASALCERGRSGEELNQPCRIYAPVGSHEDLLAYLVRRLLENGANTSFVNRLADDDAPIEDIIADPVVEVAALSAIPHPRIPVAARYFCAAAEFAGACRCGIAAHASRSWRDRKASAGGARACYRRSSWTARRCEGERPRSTSPHDRRHQWSVRSTRRRAREIDQAMAGARAPFPAGIAAEGTARGAILERAADLYERASRAS